MENDYDIIIVGTDRPRLSPQDVLAAAERARQAPGVTLPRFLDAARDLYTEPIQIADVPVLTDDYAPVELLIQRR